MGFEEIESYDMKDGNIPLNWRPGQVIAGRYRVKETFKGGMGAIYFVDHLGWGIPLAVKSPLPQLVKDEVSMKRFIREAETWVGLGIHPNIATCFYVRVLGGLPRVFIEYVDGRSLNDRIREGRLEDIPEVLDIAIQICRGMGFVHEKGVIHRDLKPANCLLTKGGLVKVTDFGLVKAGDEIKGILKIGMEKAEEHSISVTGSGFGTPEYMPPEQFEDAKHVDKRADIYAFGVMLFEMVCGKKPFVMPEEMDHVARRHYRMSFYERAHTDEVPPEPSSLRRECPRELSALILRCLEKSPEKRFSSFGEIEERLLEIYEQATGRPYFRKRPDPLKLKADALNNRAVSLLELGHDEEAEKFWEEALKADPAHFEATFNLGYYRWRKGRGRGNCLSLLKRIEDVHRDNPGFWYNLSLVEEEMGLYERAQRSAERAVELGYEGDILSFRVFKGHIGPVNSVAVTPDGKYVISGSGDGTLRLWDIETGECLRVFEGHTDSVYSSVYSVAITPDGKCAISGGRDETLRLWDIETGECLEYLRMFGDSSDGLCDVEMDIETDESFRDFRDSSDGLWGIGTDEFSWDIGTDEFSEVSKGHNTSIYSVAVTPDGRYVISGSSDKTLRVWRREMRSFRRYLISKPLSSDTLQKMEEKADSFTSKASILMEMGKYSEAYSLLKEAKAIPGYSRDPRILGMMNTCGLKAGKRREVISFWCLRMFEGHTDSVYSVAITPDGKYVISGSGDGTLRLWDIETGECLRVFEGHTDSVHSVAITPDGRYVISGSDDETLRLWDIETGECLRVFEGHTDSVHSVAITPDGRYAISGSDDETLRLWDIETGECLRIFEGHTDSVYSVAITPDGKYVISGGRDKTLRLWDIETGECLRIFGDSSDELCDVEMDIETDESFREFRDSSDGLWDIGTDEFSEVSKGHNTSIYSVAVTPDGRYVISGSGDKTLRLWEIETCRWLRVFKGHAGSVNSVAVVTPEDKYVISGSGDVTLRLWDMWTGRRHRVFKGHTAHVNSVVITSDGRYVISGSNDKTLRLWEIEWDWEFSEKRR